MEWRKVSINPTKYEVSEFGDIRKFNSDGTYENIIPYGSESDYLKHGFYDSTGKMLSIALHRIVAFAWFGPPPSTIRHPVVNHKDGNKRNNHFSNLEWISKFDDIEHAHRLGLTNPRGAAQGEKHHNAKLTEKQVIEIREFSGRLSQSELARRYGVGKGTIRDVIRGWTWRHLLHK